MGLKPSTPVPLWLALLVAGGIALILFNMMLSGGK